MAQLVETSEEDSFLAIASYLGELIDEGQVRVDRMTLKPSPDERRCLACINYLEAPFLASRDSLVQEEKTKLLETPGSRFVDECKQLYFGEKYVELIDTFAEKFDLVLSKASSDQGKFHVYVAFHSHSKLHRAPPIKETTSLTTPSLHTLQMWISA